MSRLVPSFAAALAAAVVLPTEVLAAEWMEDSTLRCGLLGELTYRL